MPRLHPTIRWASCAVVAPWLGAAPLCLAQDLEPRRWTHLPVGTDVLGVGYAYTQGDLSFDPVLLIEDAEVAAHTGVLSYTRYFALAGWTARIDAVVPLQSAEWDGLVDSVPRSVTRDGFADPVLRLSTLLVGAPALEGAEFVEYRKQNDVRTSVGAALELRFPLGDYQEDKLLNLGQNRYAIAPQLGVLHTRGEWSFELTGSMYFFTDNDEFFNGREREQDPMYLVQTHAVRTFGQAWWLSLGLAYNWAGESTIDGVPKDDERSTLLYGPAIGFQIADSLSMRLAYVRTDTLTDTGSDTDTLAVAWTYRF